MSWGIAETAPEIEKIKAESADYLGGLNSCGEIEWGIYSQAFDFYADLIQKAYELGKTEAKPHWIPVTEPPKGEFMPYYATCRSKVDDRENWVIEGIYTKYLGWKYPPMVSDGRAELIAWMPKELPEPFREVTE